MSKSNHNVILNEKYNTELQKVSKALKTKMPYESKNIEVIISPYCVLKFKRFISGKAFLKSLMKTLKSLDYQENNNDLYHTRASTDLHNVQTPLIKKLVSFFEKNVSDLLSKFFKVKLKSTISITASKYLEGDYLLCHDDKCGDRAIAFIWYLNENWYSDWGGSLDLFDKDADGQPNSIVKQLIPEYNSFVCFQVGDFTYHQVSEVLSKETPRLTINGWFHTKKTLNTSVQYFEVIPQTINPKQLPESIRLDSFVNSIYLDAKSKESLNLLFEEDRNVMLPEFLVENVYKNALLDLFQYTIKWVRKGPPNRRCYDYAVENSLESTIKSVLQTMTSKPMTEFLKGITKVDLSKYFKTGGGMRVEVQRWQEGYYSLLYDENALTETEGLDVYLFFNADRTYKGLFDTGGTILYSPSDEQAEGTVIEPMDNALCLVAKNKGETKYVQYCNHKLKYAFYVIQISFTSGK